MQAVIKYTERLSVNYKMTQTMPNYLFNDYKKYIWALT
jgi:hypothetical protein